MFSGEGNLVHYCSQEKKTGALLFQEKGSGALLFSGEKNWCSTAHVFKRRDWCSTVLGRRVMGLQYLTVFIGFIYIKTKSLPIMDSLFAVMLWLMIH